MKKRKILLIPIFLSVIISMTTVYAVTIITSRDVIYDNSKSGGSSNNVQGAIDELYEKAESSVTTDLINENMITYITNLSKKDTVNLAYDNTGDKNLRYIGSNPNNYVEFNGELWRIIGIMNNIEDEKGNKTSRAKIIKNDSLGDVAWNTTNVSDWYSSSLQILLNSGDYYNKANDFLSTGLSEEAKNMITKAKWHLGGNNTSQFDSLSYYNFERGSIVNGSRKSTWMGNIGLIYPSDYGYAVGGDSRNKCLALGMDKYENNNCPKDDWLFLSSPFWTITPYSNYSYNALAVNSSGNLGHYNIPYNNFSVHPALYLNTNLFITKGKGTKNSPYKISFEKETSADSSNASPPKIDENGKLVPVKLSDDGTVTYVSQNDKNWYNYSEKRWANAVILVDAPSTTYKIGDTIKESDIESYFVWIPKYKYKLWNTGTSSNTAHVIDIIFDIKNTTDKEGESCATPMTSGSTGNCHNGEYMTHPAFISLGVDGFWVGKFETGYKGATTTAGAQVNSSDSSKIVIKPNVYSWRKNTVYNFFVSAYNYERTLDSHMMKNTEWGAVAYLSHSVYGKSAEISINNNSSYKTGYSTLPSINQQTYPGESGDGASFNQPYNTSIGYLASTTGNITGVFDMSGGAWEYMASYISGKPALSGFTTSTLANYNARYFDVYNASSETNTYQYRILGDATGEMGPFKLYADGDKTDRWHSSWYGDVSNFIASTNPWFLRSGPPGIGILSGVFSFNYDTGASYVNNGSRLILTG